jgi:hypothetical protein
MVSWQGETDIQNKIETLITGMEQSEEHLEIQYIKKHY